MVETIITFFIGVLCIFMGALNMKGNISLLHSYHTKRVSEKDRIPFGKKIGLGTIIIGISIVIFSTLLFLTSFVFNEIIIHVANAILITGIIVGIAISFVAMIKYNKGIF